MLDRLPETGVAEEHDRGKVASLTYTWRKSMGTVLYVGATVNKPLEIDTLADVIRECAIVVPPPDEPLPCPPAESDFRARFDDSGAFYN